MKPRIFKTLFFFIIICNFNSRLSAQAPVQFLEGASLEKAIYENIQNGFPDYHGMNVQYSITINQSEDLSKNSDKIISEIENIPNFIDCKIDIQNKLVIVKCPKEKNDENFSKIKEILDRNNIGAVDFIEQIYKK